MGTAEKSAAHFDSVSNNSGFAVLANWCHRLDCALEAVECMASAGRYQFEAFVVFVATNFTRSHIKKLLSSLRKN
jgi:hypothetical protein